MSFVPNVSRRVALAMLPAAMVAAMQPSSSRAQGAGHAHSHAQHGGQAQKIGRYEAELAVRAGEVSLYLLDEADRPVDAAGFVAAAQVLAAGNQQRMMELRHAGGNRLAGRVEFQVDGRFRATVTLREAAGTEVGRARYTVDAAR